MLNNKNKKMSQLRDIVLLGGIVTQCRAMGFRVDSAIASMVEECKELIDYTIGDKLTFNQQQFNDIVDPIRNQITEEFMKNSEGMADSEKSIYEAECNKKIQDSLNEDAVQVQLKKNKDEFNSIWKTETYHEFPAIQIQDQEYKDMFPDEEKSYEYGGGSLTKKGYDALLLLIARKVIVLEEK